MSKNGPKTYLGKNIGLYFGSFNPVHIGHLAIANYMVEYTEIEKLWFVVTPQSPHKNKKGLLNDYDRLDLVKKAVAGDDRFQVCDIEFYLPKPSYTTDTLAYLSDRNPTLNFKILIGSDNLKNFHKWKNYETIIDNYGLIIYPRRGYKNTRYKDHPNIIVTDAPQMDISSSFIRDAIKSGKDIRHFLPHNIREYMNDKGFYR